MKKRIDYIDIIRALGIICMVSGHLPNVNPSWNLYIHAFHMPIFFIISGLFFKTQESFFVFIYKKVKTLLVPYFTFGLMYCVVQLAITRDANLFFASIRNIFTYNNVSLPLAGALWFLTTLFFSEVIFYLIMKIKNRFSKNILCIILSISGCLLNSIFYINLPLSINTSLVSIIFLLIGYIIRQKNEKNDIIFNLKTSYLLIIIVLNIFFIFLNGTINMRTGQYGFPLLFYLNAFTSYIILANISKKVANKTIKIKKGMVNIGKNSLAYLCLNQPIILVVCKIPNIIISIFDIGFLPPLFYILELIFTILLISVTDKIFSGKLFYNLMLGRKIGPLQK